jgi:hypothetical protein
VERIESDFSIFQKELKITSGPFLGSIVTCQINPGESGDLIGPTYLKCTLPYNINLIDRVGVALVDKYELYFDSLLIETYDSDWFTIHNELFLTANEILALEPMINGSDLMIPLLFFFCKDHKTYLPICALKNQKVFIKIYFKPQSWFTDTTDTIELSKVSLIYDNIFLTTQEKNYYMKNQINLKIPKYYKETPFDFTNAYSTINFTANFNVTMLVWFIRNKSIYLTDYRKRYQYGYISNLVRSYINYVDWRGNTRYYQKIFDDVQIYVNNQNIVSGISDDLYYGYYQPLEHGLSIPDKNIYMYCFGSDIKSETNNGYINFSNYPTKTTNMNILFNNKLTAELIKDFQLWFYYYGQTTVIFNGGYGTLQSVF